MNKTIDDLALLQEETNRLLLQLVNETGASSFLLNRLGRVNYTTNDILIDSIAETTLKGFTEKQYYDYANYIKLLNTAINQNVRNAEPIDPQILRYFNNPPFNQLLPLYKRQLSDIIKYNNDVRAGIAPVFGDYFLTFEIIESPSIVKKIEDDRIKNYIKPKPPTLDGTQNVIFNMLENQTPNIYMQKIGDYLRIDEEGLTPCKLRFNPKNADYPFTCTQEYKGKTKINYFDDITKAVFFCCQGGFYADYLGVKQQNNYDINTKKPPRPHYFVSY